MPEPLQIRPTSPERVMPALELLFRSLPRDERAAQMATTYAALRAGKLTTDGLFEAVRGNQLDGVVWASANGGRTALLWPAVVVNDDENTSAKLLNAVEGWMAGHRMNLVNAYLHDDRGDEALRLTAVGYTCAAEILYLVSGRSEFPDELPAADLEFVPACDNDSHRLVKIIEATYRGTLDCPQLNGMQTTEDVLAGYRESGVFRPELWMLVRRGEKDVGCLLLADHPANGQYELIYQGVTPAARGNGWGIQITRHAQWLARQAGRERLVLAVDANNRPALNIYREAGFRQWDSRFVFVKSLSDQHKASPTTRAA